ncbi:MAG: M24 family metallopeptidase [Candidatus Bathyarchaeia archaeon]
MEEVIDKIRGRLEVSEYDAILVFGADNIQYLSDAPLIFPFTFPERYMAIFWPRGGEPVCICPEEWTSSFLNMSWMTKTRPYTERTDNITTVTEIAENLARSMVRKTGKIGIDFDRVPSSLFDKLVDVLSEFDLVSCDDWLMGLRMVKTKSEIEKMEDIAYRTDHALMAQAHHILVTNVGSEMGLSEGIRIHAMERGIDVVGHNSVAKVASGTNTKKLWPLAPMYGIGYDRKSKKQEWVRMEMKTVLNGYWSDAARMLTMGVPTEEQRKAYDELVELRNVALDNIKPGKKAKEVYNAMKAEAAERGADLLYELGVGHGIGVKDREPPFLNESDETELEPGMVLILDPIVRTDKGELLRSKDTVVITEEGAKIVGWYKDWREPFIANYTY